jgi:RNA polymerase sigma factor (sigma-70 family)
VLTAAPAYIPDNQHELIRKCISGEPAAYQSLYRQHAKAMYNTAYRLLNNHADCEDVLQEAFTDAFRSLNRFNFNFTFGTWVKKIVVNKCINHLRKKKAVMLPIGEKTPEPAAESGPDEWQHAARVDAIRQGIAELPDAYRAVLSLYLFEDYSQEEIAGLLGISHSNVRVQYMRGKQKLIELLKKQGIYGQPV